MRRQILKHQKRGRVTGIETLTQGLASAPASGLSDSFMLQQTIATGGEGPGEIGRRASLKSGGGRGESKRVERYPALLFPGTLYSILGAHGRQSQLKLHALAAIEAPATSARVSRTCPQDSVHWSVQVASASMTSVDLPYDQFADKELIRIASSLANSPRSDIKWQHLHIFSHDIVQSTRYAGINRREDTLRRPFLWPGPMHDQAGRVCK